MVEVKLYNPRDLDEAEWRALQGIERDAFKSTLNRTAEEIDELVGWDDPKRFYNSHIDPNTEVGKRYNPDQEYTNPKVVVATESGELTGFAFSACNVSGESEEVRKAKRLSVIRNYLWLRECAVKPKFQRQGQATRLARTLLEDAILLQPITLYAWPDEDPGFILEAFERYSFSIKGKAPAKIFGPNSKPVRQLRMQAPSVRKVLRRL